MTRKKEQPKVETMEEFRNRMVKELTVEEFNIAAYDIKSMLNSLQELCRNVGTLRALMSDKYKRNLQKKYPNADIEALGYHDIKKYRKKIERNLDDLSVAVASVKQIERLPDVYDIVGMIEREPDNRTIQI